MDLLESRVASLEVKLGATVSGKETDKIVDPLLLLSSKLGVLTLHKEKLAILLKRVEELEKYTDPFYLEERGNVESTAKLCYVASMAKRAEDFCNLIDETDVNNVDVMGRRFLSSSLACDVNELSKRVTNTKVTTKEQTLSTSSLLESYSNMVSTLNTILTTWDRKLLALESLVE